MSEPPALPSEALPDAWLMHVARRGMGTEFEVLLPRDAPAADTDAALLALDEVERLERMLSVYLPASSISRINALAGDTLAVRVEKEVLEVLQCAREVSQWTGGAFDVTAGPLVQAWGFMQRQGRKPSSDEIEAARRLVGWDRIEWDLDKGTVRLPQAGMQINLGGIGKGYAVDRGADALIGRNVEHYLLHGGQSSAIARGCQSDSVPGWAVSLGHPTRSQQRLGRVFLENRALATSGSGKQFFHFQGRRMGHVIDPRSGWPAGDLLSLTVLAPNAMLADAIATGLFVQGRDAAVAFAKQRPEIGIIAVAAEGGREAEVTIEAINVTDCWQPEPSVSAASPSPD